eukprot:jgi/Tetstr1/439955/TSEL_003021.t1
MPRLSVALRAEAASTPDAQSGQLELAAASADHASAPVTPQQATRQRWSGLVQYCRENSGLDEVTKRGHSYRYNVKVEREEHLAVLAALNITPEMAPDGTWLGLDPHKTANPLDDPAHPLNLAKAEKHRMYEW